MLRHVAIALVGIKQEKLELRVKAPQFLQRGMVAPAEAANLRRLKTLGRNGARRSGIDGGSVMESFQGKLGSQLASERNALLKSSGHGVLAG